MAGLLTQEPKQLHSHPPHRAKAIHIVSKLALHTYEFSDALICLQMEAVFPLPVARHSGQIPKIYGFRSDIRCMQSWTSK
jgi:hypothetical protein